MKQDLLVASHDAVLTLTVNRPEQRNALSLSLLDQIGVALADHGKEDGLRCAVVTATGDRAFAAGGDLKELDAVRSEVDARAMSRRGRAALDAIRNFPVPVVAALNGLALGGGAELAMACDLRIAAPNAEIGFLQAQLNVTTAWGGGIDLIAAVGVSQALELLLSARRVTAPLALELGLVARVCAPEQSLDDCLQEFIAPWRKRSPAVLRGFKALARVRRQALHEQLRDFEAQGFVQTWIHEDHWDAVAAAAKSRGQKAR
ncbi:MAG: enoyl-CoA hydratase/isomerase family protein [Gammaproteobacteria bacterium]|nr:enoyl-CoA hydratase/isomerase family protein [Gammaproteobacteria bacterium]